MTSNSSNRAVQKNKRVNPTVKVVIIRTMVTHFRTKKGELIQNSDQLILSDKLNRGC
ncbi:hypothetical protein SynBIOSE41_02825 [Synechococcus sp. BIOS-E4-1]|nr:hypothetical protein SynBIOSE41_02825 [Synechococcus sp. BIOS-E4-1]